MKKFIISLLFLGMALPVLSQKKMESEDLLKIQRIGGQITDAKGELLVYLVTTMNTEANKGVRRAEMLRIANGEQKLIIPESYSPHDLCFSPDGKRLGFISSIDGSAQLWEVDLATQNFAKRTDIEGGILFYQYDPKGERIAFGRRIKLDKEVKELYPNLPKTEARIIDGLMYRHWDSWSDYSYNHIFIATYSSTILSSQAIDIMEGERFHSPSMPFGGAEEVCFSPDGKKLLYSCKKLSGTASANSTNSDIYEYDITTKLTRNLSEFNKGYDLAPSFNKDGSKLAWLSMEREGYESDKNRIMVLDVKKQSYRDATASFANAVESFAWSMDGTEIYFTATVNACSQIFIYSLKSGLIRQLTNGLHNINAITPIGPSSKPHVVANRVSISEPATLILVDNKGVMRPLETWNSQLLSTIAMGKVEKRMVKTSDNKEMLSWVIYPPDFDPTKKYPTLLYCQGGPQSPVSQFFSYRWNFQLMAAKGYIVVAPNRRGLQGFGSEWNDAIGQDYGGQAMQDLLSAIDDISKEPFVDKDRLGAVGASFGGYSVYWLAGNHEKRFKAFISHCGMFNMESWYGSTEEMFFANYDNGPYWLPENKENYKKHSPHRYVEKWDTPILVIHNELDYRVPLSEGLQAFNAAQQQNIPSRFLYFPDEGHWVNKPQNGLLWHSVFFEWLDTYLK